jgi:hypothetical protein
MTPNRSLISSVESSWALAESSRAAISGASGNDLTAKLELNFLLMFQSVSNERYSVEVLQVIVEIAEVVAYQFSAVPVGALMVAAMVVEQNLIAAAVVVQNAWKYISSLSTAAILLNYVNSISVLSYR